MGGTMKDIFGNKTPVLIEIDEWWFNGRIIQKQTDARLPTWISFADDGSVLIQVHDSKKDAIKYCLENPCKKTNQVIMTAIRIEQKWNSLNAMQKRSFGTRFITHESNLNAWNKPYSELSAWKKVTVDKNLESTSVESLNEVIS